MKGNKTRLLYCGDDNLQQSARYLYGVLKHLGYVLDYVPSRQSFNSHYLQGKYEAVILSDYPCKMITPATQQKLVQKVAGGTGLLMIGGWGSFHGYDGHYHCSKLAEVLPVQCLSRDDRVSCMQGAMIMPTRQAGPLWQGLHFARGPLIGGYNKVQLKKGSQVLLNVRDLQVDLPKFKLARKEYPLLVTAKYGLGCTAGYMSDLAPHWSGGLVDWGKKKIKIKNVSGQFMEVGQNYIQFIHALITLVLSKEQG
jgi:uncharacterized membrane protein